MKKVIFISSTGGHLSELMQLKDIFKKYDYHIITDMISYMFKFSYNIIKSFFLYIKIRPDVIVTTGAHTAVPMCYIAKLFNKKVVFIESFARVNSKSMSGKIINKIADIFIVQHEEMTKVYDNAIYRGELY